MRILAWLVRAALFFTLFAFALNNQHEASIRWFFSHEWRAPMAVSYTHLTLPTILLV